MARSVTKATRKAKKAASPARKAAKAKPPKTAGKEKASAPKGRVKPPKAVPKKKASPKTASKSAPKKAAAPRPNTAGPATKKASKPTRAATKPKKAGAKPAPVLAAKKAAKQPKPVPTPKPVRRSKPSPAELEALRIAHEQRVAHERQSDQFDKAITAFNSRRFPRALALFEKAVDGPDPTFRDRARVYIEICRRQTQTRRIKLKTADELYNYGIQLINERKFQEAGRNIAQALKMQPRAAHIHFAAAVVGALTRDTEGTYKSLKRAIELDPRNRVLALNDADLASVTDEPAIAKLLHGES